MPKFELESKTFPEMIYNLKARGGAKLDGAAKVDVVCNKKNQEVDDQTEISDDLMQYLEYTLNRVENS